MHDDFTKIKTGKSNYFLKMAKNTLLCIRQASFLRTETKPFSLEVEAEWPDSRHAFSLPSLFPVSYFRTDLRVWQHKSICKFIIDDCGIRLHYGQSERHRQFWITLQFPRCFQDFPYPENEDKVCWRLTVTQLTIRSNGINS